MTDLKNLPKFGTKGYIVGYDGQEVGGDIPRGRWVLPVEGIQGHAKVHSSFDSAMEELKSLPFATKKSMTLGGLKELTIAVHEIKVKWLPINEGHIGYAKTEPVKTRMLGNVKHKLGTWVWLSAIAAIIFTVFDALASFATIALNGKASEGNGVINLFVDWMMSLGMDWTTSFGLAMIVRAALGVGFVALLTVIARYAKLNGERRLAKFGIVLSAVVLFCFAVYHFILITFL